MQDSMVAADHCADVIKGNRQPQHLDRDLMDTVKCQAPFTRILLGKAEMVFSEQSILSSHL